LYQCEVSNWGILLNLHHTVAQFTTLVPVFSAEVTERHHHQQTNYAHLPQLLKIAMKRKNEVVSSVSAWAT
jgi:hypothetical protein